MKNLLQERVDDEPESLNELPDYEQREIVQDWVFAAEIDAELMHDPIAKRASILEYKCDEMGLGQAKEEYLTDPQLPDLRQGIGLLGLDLDSLTERAKAWQKVFREGCRVIVETPKVAVVRTVWVRNCQGIGVSPFWIAKNIAHYLAFKAAYKLLSR